MTDVAKKSTLGQVEPSSARAEASPTEPEVEIRVPLVDIAQGENGVTMWFEVPGANSSSVNIEINERVLSVEAASSLKFKGRPLMFRREFQLSDGAETEGIEARTANGVLTLTIPKSERAKVHKIKVG